MSDKHLKQADRDQIRDITARRRAAFAEVRAQWPTNEQLAERFGCCRRVIERWASVGVADAVSHGTRRSGRRINREAELDELADKLRGA